MAELNLKSGTKAPKRIDQVVTTTPVQFFGIVGTQVSPKMSSGQLHLEWNGTVVVVTHDGYPGEERWLFPASIAFISWKS